MDDSYAVEIEQVEIVTKELAENPPTQDLVERAEFTINSLESEFRAGELPDRLQAMLSALRVSLRGE